METVLDSSQNFANIIEIVLYKQKAVRIRQSGHKENIFFHSASLLLSILIHLVY